MALPRWIAISVATEPAEDDPLNKVYPGQFTYGGGHVIEDLVRGESVFFESKAYGTDCYASRKCKKEVRLDELPFALLCNPRNGYQNYNCAIKSFGKDGIHLYGYAQAAWSERNLLQCRLLEPAVQ